MFGSPPVNDAGKVPVAVPTKVPCRDVLLQGPFAADPMLGLFFSNSTASSPECVSICPFLSTLCFWELFTFHLYCERRRSPFTYKTPLWSQTHRRLKTRWEVSPSKWRAWRKSRASEVFSRTTLQRPYKGRFLAHRLDCCCSTSLLCSQHRIHCDYVMSSPRGCCDGRGIAQLKSGVQPTQAWPCTQDLQHFTLHPFTLICFLNMLLFPLSFDARSVECPRRTIALNQLPL